MGSDASHVASQVPVTTKTIHPAVSVKGALTTLSGILAALAGCGTAATTFITLFHSSTASLDLTYVLGGVTFATILVHNFSAQFGSSSS